MNEQSTQKSRNWKPLLLIPAAIIVVKAASHHRLRWDEAAGPRGKGHRHGGRGFGPRAWLAEDGTVRLPPKMEAVLQAWHTQAHEQHEGPEPATD